MSLKPDLVNQGCNWMSFVLFLLKLSLLVLC